MDITVPIALSDQSQYQHRDAKAQLHQRLHLFLWFGGCAVVLCVNLDTSTNCTCHASCVFQVFSHVLQPCVLFYTKLACYIDH